MHSQTLTRNINCNLVIMKFSSMFILFYTFLLAQTCQFSSASQGLASVHAKNKLVPAVYVFGDSLVDSGNNNYLKTSAKVNYTPYGVDFPNGVATGRFTDGYTVVDFLAKWLGLSYIPPYMSLSEEERSQTTTGINYASGAAGILP
ncbi:hypothetical protein C5167_034868 [Papaver somniferum]|uniref:GDSL esterase/lipase n=1 Tax=Papaver somniferum TaxID=3469 RepID=A0A4Y7KFS2_PAPSO|nr:hypothetical protein C5167_034868 [Papaver somniferum]